MSGVDVLVLIPLVPLAPIVVTWWLPWERLFDYVPQKILGPYFLYAAFAAWHFKWDLWSVFLLGLVGIVISIVAVAGRDSKAR